MIGDIIILVPDRDLKYKMKTSVDNYWSLANIFVPLTIYDIG